MSAPETFRCRSCGGWGQEPHGADTRPFEDPHTPADLIFHPDCCPECQENNT